jgi:hypothetical protein
VRVRIQRLTLNAQLAFGKPTAAGAQCSIIF